MPFSLKESKEKKLLKKVIQSKDTIPAEELIVKLIKLMSDEVNKRVVVHNMIKSMEKGLEEKKFIRLMCLFYRLMDVDVNSFILNQLAIKEDMVINTIPKGSAKNTQIFAKHIQHKVSLFSSFSVLLTAENDAPEIIDDSNKEESFSILELLIDIAKNIQEFTIGLTPSIQFHMSDILLLELTIAFFKINCYASSLANALLKMNVDESQRFMEIVKNVDRIRHKYFTILQNKTVKEKFVDLPSLSFMPTGPLQTFLNKRIDKIQKGDNTSKMDKEIETFNQTFQSDIVANEVKIKQFISRPLISINEGEDARESLSRSISRSASSMDPNRSTSVNSMGGSSLEFTPKTPHLTVTRVSSKPAKDDSAVAKPVAKRVHSKKETLQRPSTSFALLEDSDDDF